MKVDIEKEDQLLRLERVIWNRAKLALFDLTNIPDQYRITAGAFGYRVGAVGLNLFQYGVRDEAGEPRLQRVILENRHVDIIDPRIGRSFYISELILATRGEKPNQEENCES